MNDNDTDFNVELTIGHCNSSPIWTIKSFFVLFQPEVWDWNIFQVILSQISTLPDPPPEYYEWPTCFSKHPKTPQPKIRFRIHVD